MITIADVLKQLEHDLAWKGPNGRGLSQIVLTRDEAEYLHSWALALIHERDELVAEQARAQDKP